MPGFGFFWQNCSHLLSRRIVTTAKARRSGRRRYRRPLYRINAGHSARHPVACRILPAGCQLPLRRRKPEPSPNHDDQHLASVHDLPPSAGTSSTSASYFTLPAPEDNPLLMNVSDWPCVPQPKGLPTDRAVQSLQARIARNTADALSFFQLMIMVASPCVYTTFWNRGPEIHKCDRCTVR